MIDQVSRAVQPFRRYRIVTIRFDETSPNPSHTPVRRVTLTIHPGEVPAGDKGGPVNHVITLDLGPTSDFLGYPTQVDGEMVCVLASRAVEDRALQERVRRFMKGEGRDCVTCGGCPVGQKP